MLWMMQQNIRAIDLLVENHYSIFIKYKVLHVWKKLDYV